MHNYLTGILAVAVAISLLGAQSAGAAQPDERPFHAGRRYRVEIAVMGGPVSEIQVMAISGNWLKTDRGWLNSNWILTATPISGTESAKTDPRQAEGNTKANLGTIRSALSAYYGDLNGNFPSRLSELTKTGRYLKRLPGADTGHHPKTAAPILACDLPSDLKDTGGWAYCNKPGHKNFGNVWVDCTHADSKGTPWYSY